MRWLRLMYTRLTGWSGKSRREAELQEELDSCLRMHAEDNIRSGMSPEEARRQAILRFGSLESTKEEVREMWTLQWVETTLQDVRYALRGFRLNPGFASAAILSIALGIGSAIAVFTVADNLLLRPLPYPEPGALMMLWDRNTQRPQFQFNVVSPGNFRDWKAQADVFESMAGFSSARSVFSDGTRTDELSKQLVTANLLPMLGVTPIRGRLFTEAEDRPGSNNTVLISHRLWQTWFAGDENIIGRKVQVSSTPREIVGVLPPGFSFHDRKVDLWETLSLNPAEDYRKTQGRWLMAIGRLRNGVTRDQAQARMTAIAQRLEAAYPAFNKNWIILVEPLRDSLVREVKTSLLILLGAVGLLLAVSCANVANLLLARCSSRQREMLVRASLGAGRWRVARQLLTESVVLGLTGGMLGLLFARWAVVGLLALAPKSLSRAAEISVDLRIVVAAVVLSVFTGIVFGFSPGFVASRSLSPGLGGRSVAGSGGRLRGWLVGAEVALSLILLTGAGLLFRSLAELQSVPPGLNPASVLTFRVSLPGARYREPGRTQFFEKSIDGLRQIPGVQSASAISHLPFDSMAAATWIHFKDRPVPKPGEELVATVRTVMPGYFLTLGIPVQRGRDFRQTDNTAGSPYRFIVNESFVKRFIPGEDPLSKSVSVLMARNNPFGEIIGVVGDVREGSLDKEAVPTVYYPHAHLDYTSMFLVVRASTDADSLAGPARRVINGIDPAQPVAELRTMETVIGETLSRNRFSTILIAAFSLISLVLAGVGIYGVLAYSVSERTREIGLRMALGAMPGQVIRTVLSAGARMVAAGLVVGLAGALGLSGALTTLLYRTDPKDPSTFVSVTAALIFVALAAAWLPARRAASVDPASALRAE